MWRRSSAVAFLAWEKDNWAPLRARLGSLGSRLLVDVAGSLCTKQDGDDAKAFFEQATQGVEGTKRGLEEGLEQAGLCTALREHGAAAVAKYLEKTR